VTRTTAAAFECPVERLDGGCIEVSPGIQKKKRRDPVACSFGNVLRDTDKREVQFSERLMFFDYQSIWLTPPRFCRATG
jgi:hypothetical protein